MENGKINFIIPMLIAALCFTACNNTLNEKRVVEIVDSILVSKNLIQKEETKKNNIINSFLGAWTNTDEEENMAGVAIREDNSMYLSNSVCEMDLKYELKENELLLTYVGTQCKFQPNDKNEIGKKMGKCYIKNNQLYVEITSFIEIGAGFGNGIYKLNKN